MESGFSATRLAQEVGRRIKEARLERGLTRREFGAKFGVSQQQIHKYESGKDTVPLHRLIAIAAMCGVPPQAFWWQADMPAEAASMVGAIVASTLQLARAYRRIGDAKVRKCLLQLVTQIAGDGGESGH